MSKYTLKHLNTVKLVYVFIANTKLGSINPRYETFTVTFRVVSNGYRAKMIIRRGDMVDYKNTYRYPTEYTAKRLLLNYLKNYKGE